MKALTDIESAVRAQLGANAMTDVAERFQRDVAAHKMTVLHDDGLYRHLRFRKPAPGSSEYWFDLITWPGVLTINGDCGTFAFAREDDMIAFFRMGSRRQRIDYRYWAEKLRAPEPAKAKRYSADVLRQRVMEDAKENEDDYPGLTAAIEAAFFGQAASEIYADYEDEARRLLADFKFGDKWAAECSCGKRHEEGSEHGARMWRIQHTGHGHTVSEVKLTEGFRFYDTWEWDLAEFDWTFVWCCNAIAWGVRHYERAQLAAAAAALPHRVAEVTRALMERQGAQVGCNGPLTTLEVCEYDSNALHPQGTHNALVRAMRRRLVDRTRESGRDLWFATNAAWEMRSALEELVLAREGEANG